MAVEYRAKGKDREISTRDQDYDRLYVPPARPTAPWSPEVEARIRALHRDRRSS